jgi:aspartate/methionine/tyrosine aminotransferase
MINYCGAKPVPVPLLEARGFSFDLDVFRAKLSHRTRLVILNSPANPTGGVLPEDDVRAIAALLADRDVIVLSDEIYSRMSYARPAASIAAMPGMFDKTVILDGFSKTYAMTGWRIGYGHFPAWLVDPVNKLMVNSNSCTASFTQRAALAALEGNQEPAESMIAEFRRRRGVFVEKLNTIPGFRCALPEGAFYAFPNIEATGWKSKPLADALLQEAGVACLSGTAFGAFGEGYLRLSYANSMENLNEAASRIARFLATHPPR